MDTWKNDNWIYLHNCIIDIKSCHLLSPDLELDITFLPPDLPVISHHPSLPLLNLPQFVWAEAVKILVVSPCRGRCGGTLPPYPWPPQHPSSATWSLSWFSPCPYLPIMLIFYFRTFQYHRKVKWRWIKVDNLLDIFIIYVPTVQSPNLLL